MSFDLTTSDPHQSFTLGHYTPKYEAEVYPTIKQGMMLKSLCLHFKGTGKQVGFNYIGLKGFGNKNRRGIVQGKYEVIPTLQEQTGKSMFEGQKFIE